MKKRRKEDEEKKRREQEEHTRREKDRPTNSKTNEKPVDRRSTYRNAYPEMSIQPFSRLFLCSAVCNPATCVFDDTLECPLETRAPSGSYG